MTLLDTYPERFRDRVEITESRCWRWLGGMDTRRRYGLYRHTTAHRWAWSYRYGPVPDGLNMDHWMWPDYDCIGKLCVNPNHVRPVTPRENVLRGSSPPAQCDRQVVCHLGHELVTRSNGKRQCYVCHNEQRRRAYAQMKGGLS